MKKLIIFLSVVCSIFLFSCKGSTDSPDPIPDPLPDDELGTLDDYTMLCYKVLITKGSDTDYQKAFFSFEDGTGAFANCYNGTLDEKDVIVINYESLNTINFVKKDKIWLGIDPQNSEDKQYFIEKDGQSRIWSQIDMDYLYSKALDLAIIENENKQYLTNILGGTDLPESAQLFKVEQNGVYSTENLPSEITIDFWGEPSQIKITGKLIFGNNIYYISDDQEW